MESVISPPQTRQLEALQKEIVRLKSELKRQQSLYENSHQELIKSMVESDLRAQQIHKAHQQLARTFLGSIDILQRIIDLRKPGYYEHSMRVAKVSRAIAKHAGARPAEVNEVFLAARIHELGKMSLPDSILSKPKADLNENEIALLQNQYHIGANCLDETRQFRKISLVIRHVRENIDGSGLPDGLAGDDIPLGSRIIALADIFDTRFFIWHREQTIQETLDKIHRNTGTIFDERLYPFLHAQAYAQYSEEERPPDRKLKLAELQPGMVLSRDLLTVTNVLLAPKGLKLDQRIIDKIYAYQNVDPVKGGIYVDV